MANQHSITQILSNSLRVSIIFLGVLVFTNCSSYAQTLSSSNKRAIKSYEKAQEAYQKYNLKEAEGLLLEAIEKDAEFVEASTLLAYVYLDQGNYNQAKAQFKSAIAIPGKGIPNNLFFLAELELKNGEYENSEKHFLSFLKTEPREEELIERTNSSLDKITFAKKAMSQPVNFEPINLGPSINSQDAEYFPCLTVDENTLLFTRRLPSESSPQGFNEDFYVAYKKNGEWQPAENLGRPINTIFNEGAPSLSADGQILFFTACELYGDYGGNRKGFGSCDLFYSSKNGSNWTTPINLGQAINSKHWETQPSFSADGKTLYFVRGLRDRKGQRNGNIYYSELTDDYYWTKPQLLPKTINTPMNEESVFIHPDGQTLYFSSDGHPGMGGLDIFMTTKDSNGVWTEPINLGYPINTYKNENSLLVAANGKTAFFASDREEGFGDLDLYSFELAKEFRPKEVSYFAGKIIDKKTGEPLQAKFELIDLESQESVVSSNSDPTNGEFLISLPSGKDYALNASKEGYLFYSDHFSMKSTDKTDPQRKNIPLQPIEIGKKIILKNIFFETAKYNLKERSKVELDKLVAFLVNNPNIKIEISGHTDNVGSSPDNLTLSINRAKSVQDYLIKNEIAESRLKAVGYGDQQPIEDNSSAEGRAKNRRTEFKIIAD